MFSVIFVGYKANDKA